MDCVSPILEIASCIWDCSAKRAVDIWGLEKNLYSLGNDMVELMNMREDLRRRIELAGQQQMMRWREGDGWLRNAEVIETEVSRVLQEGDEEVQKGCLRSCPKNCWSSYKRNMIWRKLDAVPKSKRSFEIVACRVPCSLGDKRSMEKTVGLDLTYERVCSRPKGAQVGIIYLYGMGSVGKKILSKRINNEFLATSYDFDLVIWVLVSKPARLKKLRKSFKTNYRLMIICGKIEEKVAEI